MHMNTVLAKAVNISVCVLTASLFIIMGGLLMLKEPDSISYSERRPLAVKKSVDIDTMERYSMDQFPYRELLRGIKTSYELNVLCKIDSNKYYTREGHLSRMEYPLNEEMVDSFCSSLDSIYDIYLKNSRIVPCLAIIPDKNYFLAKNAGILSVDYDYMYKRIISQLEYMDYVELRSLLDINDYYRTDTHWRQECLTGVAEQFIKKMGAGNPPKTSYDKRIAATRFHGVYSGQSAIQALPDQLVYLSNHELDSCRVTIYDGKKPVIKHIYELQEITGRDPYDVFLSGPVAVLTIDNPITVSDRELVIFRDSYGSSLAPLLAAAYKKITLIDIRYIQAALLSDYISFNNQDVLFLYCTQSVNAVNTK